MTKKLLFVVTIALVAAFSLLAADLSGKWVAEQPGRNGGPPRQTTFDLKADGCMGRGGAAPTAIEITDGKVDGDKVSFTVKRETPNGTFEQKYSGTVSGDELTLKTTMQGPDGPVERTMTAKRSKT